MKLQVDATQSEVTHILSLALTAEEMQELSIHSGEADSDPLLSEPRRLDPLTWIALAAASGVIGNTTFALLEKAAEVLIAKYGPNHVRETPDDRKSV